MPTLPRIAILGDFPIGNICETYKSRDSFYPSWLYMLHLAFTKSNDFDVHWLIVDKKVKRNESIVIKNQTFHLITGTSLTVGLYTAYLYNRWLVSRKLKQIKPDLFHAWGTERFYGLAAKDFKGQSLLSVQGLLKACMQRGPMSAFECKHSKYEPTVLNNVDYITVESPWAKERVLEIAPKAKITICDYAVEPIFYNIERRISDEPTCLISCSNAPIKNIQLAISAFSTPELRHIKLYMAGATSDRYHNLTPNIIALGALNRAELAKYLSQTWCLIHPSLADTGPTSVKEARVAGVPVVLTTECGAKQYVNHGKSGYIIPPHNKQALIDAVLSVTASQPTSLDMGAFDVERCRKALSCDSMYTAFAMLYHRVLQS